MIRALALALVASLLCGCVHFGGDCHQATVWPLFSVVKAPCEPAHPVIISWTR